MSIFSMGSGTGFIFNREVLSRGIKRKTKRLWVSARNTYRWLAEPSLKNNAVGGYSTRENALVPINYRKLVKEFNDYTYGSWEYDVHAMARSSQERLDFQRAHRCAFPPFSDGNGNIQHIRRPRSTQGSILSCFSRPSTNSRNRNTTSLSRSARNFPTARSGSSQGSLSATTSAITHLYC